jgi:integrase
VARTVKDAKLYSRDARGKLPAGPAAHWTTIIPGKLHLGYRRNDKKRPGYWIMRRYIGIDNVPIGKSPYRKHRIGLADDFEDNDGTDVLTYADAQRLAIDRMRAMAGGRAAEAERGPPTVWAATVEYLDHLRAEGDTRAADDAERRAAAMYKHELGDTMVTDLTTTRIVRWRNTLAEQGARVRTRASEKQRHRAATTDDAKRARRATVNRTLTILKAVLNMAWRNGRVPDDKEWRRVKPFESVHAARPGYLTLGEAGRLINTCDPATGFRDLVHAALLTGARYGELCALNVRDFHRGKLHVAQSKSGKPRDVVLSKEGTDFFERLCAGRPGGDVMLVNKDWPSRKERLVARELWRRAREETERRKRQTAQEEKRERSVGLDAVAAELEARGLRDELRREIQDDMRWHKSEQDILMREACGRATIEPAVGFHQLRHTWASHAVMNSMPLLVVARNLGHADTRMVEKHYGHLAPSFIDDAIRAHSPEYGQVASSNVVPVARRAR